MCQINFYSRDCQIKFLLVMEVTLANYNNYKQGGNILLFCIYIYRREMLLTEVVIWREEQG